MEQNKTKQINPSTPQTVPPQKKPEITEIKNELTIIMTIACIKHVHTKQQQQ